MTATYSNDPAGRQIDEMRFLIDDKDTDNALLSDEEISYLIGSYRHIYLAAAAACSQIAGTYANTPESNQVGDLQISYGAGGVPMSYEARARELRGMLRQVGRVKPYAGGLSKSEKKTDRADTDLVQPAVTIGMTDSDTTQGEDGTMNY